MPTATSSKTRVLLVDDETDVVKALQFRLVTLGYDVTTALHGGEALEALEESRFEVVLADFMMPEVNGLELVRRMRLRPEWDKTKIIVFSANTEREFIRKAKDLGADEYLPKTVGANAIVERIFQLARPEVKPPKPPESAPEQAEPAYAVDGRHLRALAQSLVDLLHMVDSGGPLEKNAQYALNASRRVAREILDTTDAVPS